MKRNRSVASRPRGYWWAAAKFQKIDSFRAGHREEQPVFLTEEETRDLLEGDPKLAEARGRQALEADPEDVQARFLLAAALHAQKQHAAARIILEPLVFSQPHMAFAWRELGLALAELGERPKAREALLTAVDLDCLDKAAWYGLGNLLEFPETLKDACQPDSAGANPRIVEAQAAFRADQFEQAEAKLRGLLESSPDHPECVKSLADFLVLRNRWPEAKPLLEKCVALAPDSLSMRFRCATMLLVNRHYLLALTHIEKLLGTDPANRLYRTLKAIGLARSRQFGVAIAEYEAILRDHPELPGVWLEYARVLRIDQRENMLDAFNRALQILPSFVQAYLALAYVKTLKLDQAFVDKVRDQLERAEMSKEDRARLHYVAGKAFEDMQRYPESFQHYRKSNEILCTGRKFGSEVSTDFKRHSKRFFKSQFFRDRADVGFASGDPISSWECRARVQPWSSRSSQAIRRSRLWANCPTFRTL